jgi:glycosyltransferase involved in cell wall biosynthesis
MAPPPLKVTIGIPTYNRASLLRESIRSALTQSYEDFRLLVCDNASEDDTQKVVRSFDDSRIEYVRSDRNVGMIRNFNRVIDLADADAVVLLSDDDVLYPEYLASVVPVLSSHSSVGVVHTALDLIDEESRVIEPAMTLLDPEGPVTVESGARYLERSMQSLWTVCWSSALFRADALKKAGGLRANEEPSADVPLLMRIALAWDFAMISKPLVGVRIHPDAETARVSGWIGTGYDLSNFAEILLERRMRFLAESGLSERKTRSYRSAAERAYRREAVKRIADRGGGDMSWSATNHALLRLLRREPKVVGVPTTWRLVAAQLGARQARRVMLRRSSRDSTS